MSVVFERKERQEMKDEETNERKNQRREKDEQSL